MRSNTDTKGSQTELHWKIIAKAAGVGFATVVVAIVLVALFARPYGSSEWADLIRSSVLGLGAVAAVPAAVIAYRKQQTAEKESHLAHRIETSRQNELKEATGRADSKEFRDRYASAAGQLGHDRAAVRLAGVYAMSQLADEWGVTQSAQRQTCIDVLCAYLRMPWPGDPTFTETQTPEVERQTREELNIRRAILALIADHLHFKNYDLDEPAWYDNSFDFSGGLLPAVNIVDMYLTGSLVARGAGFFERALFEGDILSYRVDFEGAEFEDGASFGTFGQATVSFSNVIFAGEATYFKAFANKVDFANVIFAGPVMLNSGCRFEKGARFYKCTSSQNFALSEITIKEGLIQITSCKFNGMLSVDWDERIQFRESVFTGTMQRPWGSDEVTGTDLDLEQLFTKP